MTHSIECLPSENKHHIAWMKRIYKTPLEKKYRDYPGMVVPLNKLIHAELHATVPAPPKPSRANMVGCMEYLDFLVFPSPQGVYDFYKDHATGDELNNRRIYNHLQQQLGYLTLSQDMRLPSASIASA